jgi:hypothetical protein
MIAAKDGDPNPSRKLASPKINICHLARRQISPEVVGILPEWMTRVGRQGCQSVSQSALSGDAFPPGLLISNANSLEIRHHHAGIVFIKY